MSKMITKEILGGGLKPETRRVELRGGEYEIFVRPLGIGETISFAELALADDTTEAQKLNAMIDIVIVASIDSSGNRVFDESDREMIMSQFTASDLSRLVDQIADVDVGDEIEGKSEGSEGTNA